MRSACRATSPTHWPGLFIACGQDVACIAEAVVCVTRAANACRPGDIYASVTLPNLIVGTVGGGTYLPTAQECLGLLGCVGPGKAAKFAEIVAVAALAGELSIVGAMASGAFAAAHAAGGEGKPARRRTTPWPRREPPRPARHAAPLRKPVRRFVLHAIMPPLAIRGYSRLGDSWKYDTANGAGSQRPDRGAPAGGRRVPALAHLRAAALFQPAAAGRWILMCSQSRDGELMTKLEEGLGFRVARGSSGKGGARALVEMIRAQREDRGLNSCLAIDGSRGPRGIAQLGTITLAQKTGSLLLPVAASTSDAWIWKKSWDRTVVPKPGARLRIRIGEPIEVAPKLDPTPPRRCASSLEARLLGMHADLDRQTGFHDTEPMRPACRAPRMRRQRAGPRPRAAAARPPGARVGHEHPRRRPRDHARPANLPSPRPTRRPQIAPRLSTAPDGLERLSIQVIGLHHHAVRVAPSPLSSNVRALLLRGRMIHPTRSATAARRATG